MSGQNSQRANPWTSRSMGAKWQHVFFYRLIAIGGRNAAYFMLFWVVLVYMFKPSAIQRGEPYLKHRFPDARGLSLWLHRWRWQWELGKSLVDRAVAGIKGEFSFDLGEKEMDALREHFALGKGIILLASHIGSWHAALSFLAGLLPGVPASVVLLREEGDYDRHYFEHQGTRAPFTIIDPAEGPTSAIAMIQRLQGGGILSIMGDRPMGEAKLCPATFLGGEIRLPFTPFYLASVSGAPVVAFFAYRTGPGSARNHLAGIINVPEKLGKNPEAYAPYMQLYADMLEKSVMDEPYQFFNFYNMWENDEHQREA